MNTLERNACGMSCDQSYEKAHSLPLLMRTRLLPQLRGEWVRKDMGKNGEGKLRKDRARSDQFCFQHSRCSRMFHVIRDGPVWGIKTPKAAPDGVKCRLGLLRGFLQKDMPDCK
jgi:hypothetical protein